MKKLSYTLLLVFSIMHLFAQDSLSNEEKYYKNDASYNRGGLYYNGFRLKHKETIYTNTFVLLNNFGVGIGKFFELNTSFSIIPLSGESGFGVLPLILFIPKIGYDFGKFHHVGASFIFSPIMTSSKPRVINKQIVYTFGTPNNNAGILYCNNDIINEASNFVYLQTAIKLTKKIKIGMEHILYTNFDETNPRDMSFSFSKKVKSEYLIPTNFMLRISPKSSYTFCIGYITQYQYSDEQILYLSVNIRLNRKH